MKKIIDEAILLAIFLKAVGYKTFMKQIFIIKFYCFTKIFGRIYCCINNF